MPRPTRSKLPQLQATGARIIWSVTALVVGALILAALWFSVAAAFENTKFTKASGEVVQLLIAIRSKAENDPGFLQRPGYNLVAELQSNGYITSGEQIDGQMAIPNPWGRPIIATSLGNQFYRIETIVPEPACRRLVGFFSEQLQNLGLQRLEVAPAVIRDGNRDFVPVAFRPEGLSAAVINEYCALGSYVRVAIRLEFVPKPR